MDTHPSVPPNNGLKEISKNSRDKTREVESKETTRMHLEKKCEDKKRKRETAGECYSKRVKIGENGKVDEKEEKSESEWLSLQPRTTKVTNRVSPGIAKIRQVFENENGKSENDREG